MVSTTETRPRKIVIGEDPAELSAVEASERIYLANSICAEQNEMARVTVSRQYSLNSRTMNVAVPMLGTITTHASLPIQYGVM